MQEPTARAPAVSRAMLTRIGQALAADEPADPVEEVRRQNREMLAQLQELQDRQEALAELNQELQDTNRGVVALYAELDERADHLRRVDELKSKFLSNMSHEFRTPLNSVLALSITLVAAVAGCVSHSATDAISDGGLDQPFSMWMGTGPRSTPVTKSLHLTKLLRSPCRIYRHREEIV